MTALWLALSLAGAPLRAAEPAWSFSGKYKDYNVLLVAITNIGASRTSLYGYRRPTTPKLEAWAKDALVFDGAFTHASWTLPVGVSLFTSLYPYTHRVLHRELYNAIEPGVSTLPEILKANGYRTAAFTGGLDYYVGWSHMRGFQDAPDNPNFTSFRVTLEQARQWLAKNQGTKFMVFLHGYDAHCPFLPAEPFKGRFAAASSKKLTVDPNFCVRGFKSSDKYEATYAGGCPQFPKMEKCPETLGKKVQLTQDDIDFLSDSYDEKVLETDSLVGPFLGSLDPKLLAKTIVILYSEHGEMFAKHGRFGRAGTRRGTLYDDVLHVPLVVKFPGGPARRVAGLAELIDVTPTILDALAIPAPAAAQGKSLAPLLAGLPVHSYVFAGSPYNTQGLWDAMFNLWSRGESIRDERWKLIHELTIDLDRDRADAAPKKGKESNELYEVAADPEELVEVSRAHPDVVARLTAKLQDWVKTTNTARAAPVTQKVPEDLLRKARERGYWQR